MTPDLSFDASLRTTRQRTAAVRSGEYARSRNPLGGAVTSLSPCRTRGFARL